MHRAPEPGAESFLRRYARFIVGGLAVIALLAVAVGVRFSEPSGGDAGPVAPGPSSSTTSVARPAAPVTTAPTTTTATTSQPRPAPSTTVTTAAATPDDTRPSGPVYGGTVRVGVVGDPSTLNPFVLDGGTAPVAGLMWATATGAIRLDPRTLEPEPLVIEMIPSVEGGGLVLEQDGSLTVRYLIREDAVWSDGTPISAEDFRRTFEVALQAAGVRTEIRDRYRRIVPGTLVTEGREVAYRLADAGVGYLDLFDIIVPAHQVTVAGFSTQWNDEMWAAGGPFRFFDRDTDSGVVRLVANQRSWLVAGERNETLPYLDGIEIHYYPTQGALLDAVTVGEVEVAAVGGDREVLDVLAARQDLLLDVQRGPEWEQIGFQFGEGRSDVNEASLIDRAVVRRAVLSLIDRDSLAEELFGGFGRSLESVIGLSWPAAGTAVWEAAGRMDPATAVATLEAALAAAEGPARLSFATTTNDADRAVIAGRIVDALEPTGIAVDVELSEPGAFFLDTVIPGEFETASWAWVATLGPAGAIADLVDQHLVTWPQGTDFYRWDPAVGPEAETFAAQLDAASREYELPALQAALQAAEAALADSVVLIPLYAELNGAVVAIDEVGGFRHSILLGGEMATVAEWWRWDQP